MQVLEVQSAFLSNFEVLKLLQEDVSEQNKNYQAAQKLAKKAAAAGRFAPGQPYFDEQAYLSKIVPDNVRTLQVESLKYLRQEDLPCTRTTAKSMQKVLQEMDAVKPNPCDDPRVGTFGLTKAEKLMCVNLMPKSVLDLMIIVDELDLRFSEDAQAELLQVFQEDLTVSGVHGDREESKAEEALDIVKDEEEEAHKMEEQAEQKEGQLNDDVYGGEDEDYDDADIMPDEENDLIDEGHGDGGREAGGREIDEVDES